MSPNGDGSVSLLAWSMILKDLFCRQGTTNAVVYSGAASRLSRMATRQAVARCAAGVILRRCSHLTAIGVYPNTTKAGAREGPQTLRSMPRGRVARPRVLHLFLFYLFLFDFCFSAQVLHRLDELLLRRALTDVLLHFFEGRRLKRPHVVELDNVVTELGFYRFLCISAFL